MPTAKLSVELEAVIGSYMTDIQRATDSLESFGDKARQAGGILTAAFTLPLTLLAKSAVQSGAELDGLNRSMKVIEGTSEGAAKRIAVLNEVAKLPGLNFKDAVQGDVRLRSAGFSADLAKRSMMAFGNALGTVGAQAGAIGNVNVQLTQLASKTSGFGADIRILKDWVPQLGTALQQAFGTIDTEAIAKMGYTGKDVVEKLIAVLEKLPKATGGIGNAMENMSDAWFKFTGRIGLAIDKAVDLTGIFNKLSDTLNDLATWFENLDPGIQKFILGTAAAVALVGPLLLLIGSAPMLLGAMATGLTLIAGLFAGVSVPIIAMGVAFVATFKAIQDYWGETKTKLVNQAFFDDMKGLFNGMLNFISNVFGAFKNLLTGEWGALWNNLKNILILAAQPIINVAMTIFATIKNGFGQLIDSMGGHRWGKEMQANAQAMLKDLDAINADIKRRTTKKQTQYEIDKVEANKNKVDIPKLSGAGGEKTESEYEKYLQDQVYQAIVDGHKKITEADKKYFDERKSQQDAFYTNQQAYYKKIVAPLQEMIGQQSAGYDFLGTKTDAFFGRMGKSIADFAKNIKPQLTEAAQHIKDMKEQLGQIYEQGTTQALTGMAEWVGAFAVGAKSFKDLGSLIGSIFGDIMITIGKQMIATSTAVQAFKESLKGLGTGGIVIGLALVAAGSALKASSNKGASGGYQQVPQGSVSNYQPIYQPYNNSSATVNITLSSSLRGNDINQSVNNTQYDLKRM